MKGEKLVGYFLQGITVNVTLYEISGTGNAVEENNRVEIGSLRAKVLNETYCKRLLRKNN